MGGNLLFRFGLGFRRGLGSSSFFVLLHLSNWVAVRQLFDRVIYPYLNAAKSVKDDVLSVDG